MKDFKFIGISIQGLRIYQCLLCDGRFVDESVKKLRKWHSRWHKQLGIAKTTIPKGWHDLDELNIKIGHFEHCGCPECVQIK